MNRAYVETTILTNVLLKPDSKKQAAARSALSRYEETLLPVYSIKEWKAGPLDHYSYVHDKLVETRSLAYTLSAINALNPVLEARRKGTRSKRWKQLLCSTWPRPVRPAGIYPETKS